MRHPAAWAGSGPRCDWVASCRAEAVRLVRRRVSPTETLTKRACGRHVETACALGWQLAGQVPAEPRQ